ncbi:MAG: hypothetical protein RR806_06270, partial [Oscillospiraceae bacterium]
MKIVKKRLCFLIILCFFSAIAIAIQTYRNDFENSGSTQEDSNFISSSTLADSSNLQNNNTDYIPPKCSVTGSEYTRPLTEDDIAIFISQAEILSEHLKSYCVGSFFAEEPHTIIAQTIPDGFIWNFVVNLSLYNNYEVHPYNDYSLDALSISDINAQIVASELFAKENWSYGTKDKNPFGWDINTKSYYMPAAGAIITSYTLNDVQSTYVEKDNAIEISSYITATNSEISVYNSYVSKVI